MTREAQEQYQDAHKHRLEKNEARHIRTQVYNARTDSSVAGVRWPFELLQNALDAGPREGYDSVTIKVYEEMGQVVFEHDGAPFSMDELAALLSGGSSKDFDSDQTTGRFGSGFLVTHVLAERTSLEGILRLDGRFERFNLILDRSGDEAAILANIEHCNNAIEQAQLLESLDGVPSARFEYPIDDHDTLRTGLEAFRAALPYLYGTRQSLGEVHFIYPDGSAEVWSCGNRSITELEEGLVSERTIQIHTEDNEMIYKISRVASGSESAFAALVLTRPTETGWEVVIPSTTDPRIYREYPLRGTGFLPINVVFDGHFEPDPGRSKVPMTDWNKQGLLDAFNAAVIAVSYGSGQSWANSHLLARASTPDAGSVSDTPDESLWWEDALRSYAERIASLPIVKTRNGALPAISGEEAYADFILPRLGEASTIDETTVDRLWSLVNEASKLYPPVEELALDWTGIAEGWAALGLHLNRITVELLRDYVLPDTEQANVLGVDSDQYAWLARYIDVVGECWERRRGVDTSILEGLLPNQTEEFSSPHELRRDIDVPEDLKDICENVDFKIRAELVSAKLEDAIDSLSLEYADGALRKAIPRTANRDAVEKELLGHLRSKLSEDADCSAINPALLSGTAQLLSYLWKTSGEEAAARAREVPLATTGTRIAYWARERVMMAPVLAWNEAAQSFADAYPPNRVLHERVRLFERRELALISA
jgi:hypothetical protein